MHQRLTNAFFQRDVLEVAPELLGKTLVRMFPCGTGRRAMITETEAYRGEEDLACHACKGKTKRTKTMYGAGGIFYIYLVYGMHWMLNVVTGEKDMPQAVLIRGIENFNGPGKLTKYLGITKSLNGTKLEKSTGLWIEESGLVPAYDESPRIGIDYAGEIWKAKPWRYTMRNK